MARAKDYHTQLKLPVEGYRWLKAQADEYGTPMMTALRIMLINAAKQGIPDEIPEVEPCEAMLQVNIPWDVVESLGGKERTRSYVRYLLAREAGLFDVDEAQKKSERTHLMAIAFA